MKKIILLFSIFLISTFSTISQAENFYVCDSNGNDKFDGRSESKPFKSYDKAIAYFNQLEAGGELLFCRGGKFLATQQSRLYNKNCSVESPCKIGAYGNTSKSRPLIVPNKVDGINFENSGDARADGGYIVENIILISDSYSHAGIRLYNDVDDLTVKNVHLEGFNVGFYMAGSNKPLPGSNKANDRIVLRDSIIIKNKKQGMLGACNDCLIENNNFESNGASPNLDHNIYLAKSGEPARGITIRNNTLYRSAFVDGKCQGVSLVGHGLLEDVLIENNIIKEDVGAVAGNCWGISIDPGYAWDESFKNITIRNNKLINVGSHAIGCASCDGVLIEGNEIIDEGTVVGAGIKVPVREENTTKSRNVVIRNNKIIVNHETAVGIAIGGEHRATVTGNTITLPTSTRTTCFKRIEANIDTDITNNVCKLHSGVSIDDEFIIQPVVEQIDSPELTTNSPEIDQSEIVQLPNRSQEPVLSETISKVDEPILENQNPLTYTRSITASEATQPLVESIESKEEAPTKGGRLASLGTSSSSESNPVSDTLNNAEDVSESIAAFSLPTHRQLTESTPLVTDTNSSQSEVNAAPTYTRAIVDDNSISLKDVQEASRIDHSNIEITQCRAYSGSRCLMR